MNGKDDTNRLRITLTVLALVAVILLMCGGLGAAFVLPAIQAAREAVRREVAENNLQQLGAALRSYHMPLEEQALNEEQPEMEADQKISPPQDAVSKEKIEDLAQRYKAEWVVTQTDTTFQIASVFETRQIEEGWRITFESVAPGGPDGPQRQYLHVFIDREGKLSKIERAR
jgi:hypothetical protein